MILKRQSVHPLFGALVNLFSHVHMHLANQYFNLFKYFTAILVTIIAYGVVLTAIGAIMHATFYSPTIKLHSSSVQVIN